MRISSIAVMAEKIKAKVHIRKTLLKPTPIPNIQTNIASPYPILSRVRYERANKTMPGTRLYIIEDICNPPERNSVIKIAINANDDTLMETTRALMSVYAQIDR